MSNHIEMPTVSPEATVEELLIAIVERLRNVGVVIKREHDWMKSRVDYSRQIEGDYQYEVEQGFMTPEEADERRAEDNLILQRAQVDRHLSNLAIAAEHMEDAASVIYTMFIEDEPEVTS